jgi:chorismate mutase
MTGRLRGYRGAIQVSVDTPDAIKASTHKLVAEMLVRNSLELGDLVSVIFTTTPDLHSAFPAAAARELGMGGVPLLCASEIDVPGALERVIRVLMHAYGPSADVVHVYLDGAQALRQDIAQ